MRISSAKAKGRRACLAVQALLYKFARILGEGDIMIPTGSVPGKDIHFSPLAKSMYPFAIECKNQEAMNIWASLKQAESNAKDGEIPVLFFKKNNTKLYMAMDAEKFIEAWTNKWT